MASGIVQKVVAINSVGGATATATFAKPLTAGNTLVILAAALDTGAAPASNPGGTFGVQDLGVVGRVMDSQGTSFTPDVSNWVFPAAFVGSEYTKTFFVGGFYGEIGNDAGDMVTFTFTPSSSAPNCQVGLVAYEVAGINLAGLFESPIASPFASTDSDVVDPSIPVGAIDGDTFGVVISGDSSIPEFAAVFSIGIAISGDLTQLGAGSGYVSDGSAAAEIGGNFSVIGLEHQYVTKAINQDNFTVYPTFGNTIKDPASNAPWNVTYILAAQLNGAGADQGGGDVSDLSSFNAGDTLTGDQVVAIIPARVDNGHACDGVVYSGTLQGWNGRTGRVVADTDLGDAALPSQRTGEYPAARAYINDFTFTPTDGVRVKFLVNRDSAGDKLALLLTALS